MNPNQSENPESYQIAGLSRAGPEASSDFSVSDSCVPRAPFSELFPMEFPPAVMAPMIACPLRLVCSGSFACLISPVASAHYYSLLANPAHSVSLSPPFQSQSSLADPNFMVKIARTLSVS